MEYDDYDRELGRLLDAAGIGPAADDVIELVLGVAAAPASSFPGAWMDLIALDLPDALRDHLSGRLDRARAILDDPRAPGDRSNRLARLREELRKRGLAGFIVPRTDEHRGEYVPPSAERLAWLTGFTGSAGVAVVLLDRAALFVDGRYTLQARAEVATEAYEVLSLTDTPPETWIAGSLAESARAVGGRSDQADPSLGYDPWLHAPDEIARLAKSCEKAGGRALPLQNNPLDAVWLHRPPPPITPVLPHVFGRTSEEKRAEVAKILASDGQDVAVLSTPESIAWLLDIRGSDVPNTPVSLAFATITRDGDVKLYIDLRKLTPEARAHFQEAGAVTVLEVCRLDTDLGGLGQDHKRVRIDPASTPIWILDRLDKEGALVSTGPDPCLLPKAKKSSEELEGIRAAHRRDGVALARFLAWLAREAPKGEVSELAAARRIEALRAENPEFRGNSFETISGAGSNGAIVHYRVSEATDRKLGPGMLYLVDSGGQYPDGTTDVTRTIAIGAPTDEMRRRFTYVLKGHIAIASACFPQDTTGSQLDVLARRALWQAGLDYDHGTGHGVGSYLAVHEGPHRISKLPSTVKLEPGMVVSNEPGFYKEGAYGIRIENLIAVTPAEKPVADAERAMMGFETLTLAPIDRALIDLDLLDPGERAWLDTYHARVLEEIGPELDEAGRVWLKSATAPL